MYGKNEVHHKFQNESGDLVVNDVFYTLQGEGPDAGEPAVFVRLSKCNLRCWFCDTEFEKGRVWPLEHLTKAVLDLCNYHDCTLVVITGGEPLLQNILPFVRNLNDDYITVSVETAGTVWLEDLDMRFEPLRMLYGNLIVVSPKTPKIDPNIEKVMGAVKYIVDTDCLDSEDGLPMMSTQMKGQQAKLYRVAKDRSIPISVYVQPMDEDNPDKNLRNTRAAAHVCLKHGYRLSVQMHKIAQLP